MILDALLMFSDAQALTATAASTNSIDLGPARNLFDGEPMAVLLQVDVAADFTTTDETYAVAIQTDDNTAFSSATVMSTQTLTAAQLTAGAVIPIPVPTANPERYLRLSYTLGGTTPTVTVSAFLQPMSMLQKNRIYADGFTIS